jgi:hypothetical protein
MNAQDKIKTFCNLASDPEFKMSKASNKGFDAQKIRQRRKEKSQIFAFSDNLRAQRWKLYEAHRQRLLALADVDTLLRLHVSDASKQSLLATDPDADEGKDVVDEESKATGSQPRERKIHREALDCLKEGKYVSPPKGHTGRKLPTWTYESEFTEDEKSWTLRQWATWWMTLVGFKAFTYV